jgi:hypothetical protein
MSSAGLPKVWRGLNAGSYTPPPLLVCLQPRLLRPSSANARSYQAGPPRQPRRPPSVLSLFAQLGCYLRWGDVIRLLGGRYPSFVAHTGSCATPVELSLPSVFSLVPRVLAGCTQSLLLTAASRRYLWKSFLGCWIPFPGGTPCALACFFHGIIGLPPAKMGSATRICPANDFSQAGVSRMQIFRNVPASKFAHPPDRSYRCEYRRRAAGASTSGHIVLCCLRTHRTC